MTYHFSFYGVELTDHPLRLRSELLRASISMKMKQLPVNLFKMSK